MSEKQPLATRSDLNTHLIIGVDEAGRGALAGPVAAAAYCFTCEAFEKEMAMCLDDSKKLTPQKREEYARTLQSNTAHGFGAVVFVNIHVIDHINILKATFQAMTKAVHQVNRYIGAQRVTILIDGNQRPPELPESQTVVKGDAQITAIAAASILAKVERDRMMTTLHHDFKHFHWDKNKGYGTQVHRAAMMRYGRSPHHRRSFIRNLG